MSEGNVMTIGNLAPNNGTTTLDISQFCITGEDGGISININKEENEVKIVEELNTLLLQEAKDLTGDNINIIQELLNKLPFEEKRIELTYRKEDILKGLKVKKEIQDIENNITDENSIEKMEDILSLMNKYMEIKIISKNNDLSLIEDNLIKLHKVRFEGLLSKENYSFVSISDNLEKHEILRNQIERLQKDINLVSNINLKNAIMEELNLLNDKKSNIEGKLEVLLNCAKSSLDLSVKLQKFITIINNSALPEQIDIALIENNFIDYINLGQKKRKNALIMFIEKRNMKYTTREEVNKDLDVIVNELKNQNYASDTIEF